MTGARLAAALSIAGSVTALVLFQSVGRSEDFVDGFLLMYGIGPLAALGCVLGVSRLSSSLPSRLQVITAALWALSLNAFALSQRIAEVALASQDPALLQAMVALLWATALAMVASGLRSLTVRTAVSRISQIAEGVAFGVLGLYLFRAGAIVWGSILFTRSGGIAAVVFESQLRLYVCIATTVAFAGAAIAAWLSRRAAT